MAPVPVHRVTPNPPFTACGTDLMGPLYVKIGKSRIKRYVCVFNCLTTRVVHFEIVQSLEASAFIQAFRRFCNRRVARVRHVHSGNGGNFVPANKELNEELRVWNSKKFRDAVLQERIAWRFSPPLASHHNDVTERYFRSVRKILRAISGESTLDEFDLLTLITEVERILNDRPITCLPSGPHELAALTPSMILSGSIADCASPDVFLKTSGYRHSWRKKQYLTDVFWDRWLKEYWRLLQPRVKRCGSLPNVNVGDLVLIKDKNTKRECRPKGSSSRWCLVTMDWCVAFVLKRRMAEWTVTYAKCVCWKEFEIQWIKAGLWHWHIGTSVFTARIVIVTHLP